MDAQFFEAQCAADNINNGIDASHFMEMNFVQIATMDIGFGPGQRLEYGQATGFNGIRQGAIFQQ
jgi:hypothetical protein